MATPQPALQWAAWAAVALEVIAVHSPEAHLHSISGCTIWMVAVGCWLHTYWSLCMCSIAPFQWHVFHFYTDRPNRKRGNCIGDGIVFTDREAYSLHFINQNATVNIHRENKQSQWGDYMCESQNKFIVTLLYIPQFNRVVLTLFSCCSWIDLPHVLHLTQMHGLLGI